MLNRFLSFEADETQSWNEPSCRDASFAGLEEGKLMRNDRAARSELFPVLFSPTRKINSTNRAYLTLESSIIVHVQVIETCHQLPSPL